MHNDKDNDAVEQTGRGLEKQEKVKGEGEEGEKAKKEIR